MSGNAPVSDDQQVAREILRRYMTDSGCSLSALERRAGVHRSILSRFLAGQRCLRMKSASQLYCAIAAHISVVERRDFLKSVGLLPLFLTASRDWELLGYLTGEAHPSAAAGHPFPAHRLLVIGHEVAQQGRWEAAIQVLRQAEEAFGPASSQAARAGVEVAQLYINLGDLEAAGTELSRVEREYTGVMDPETTAHLRTRQGWLDYYLGNLHQAAEHFQAVLAIAREYGMEHLEHVRHFLGRTYRDLGAQYRRGETRE